MIINQSPTIHQNISSDEPNVPWCPLGLHLSRTPTKVKSPVMFINKLPTIRPKQSNLRNCFEANQCIVGDRWNHKHGQPRHDITQAWGGRKYVCPVWIKPTDNFQSHLSTSFRINEFWSNVCDTHKSTINNRRLEIITRWIF